MSETNLDAQPAPETPAKRKPRAPSRKCATCNGRGWKRVKHALVTCTACGGTGREAINDQTNEVK